MRHRLAGRRRSENVGGDFRGTVLFLNGRKEVLVFQAFPSGKGIVFEFLGNLDAAFFKRFCGFLTFQQGGLERFKPAVQLLKGVLLVGFELHKP